MRADYVAIKFAQADKRASGGCCRQLISALVRIGTRQNPGAGSAGFRHDGGEYGLQLVETEGTKVEGRGVERFEVERLPGAGFGRVPGAEPSALAQLVSDGLGGPPEVAFDLTGHEVGREA